MGVRPEILIEDCEFQYFRPDPRFRKSTVFSLAMLLPTKTRRATTNPISGPYASDSNASAFGRHITEKIIVIQGIHAQFVAATVAKAILKSV